MRTFHVMIDPVAAMIGSLLSQVFGDMASDLIESLAWAPRGAGLVDDPLRVEPRRPSGLRSRRMDRAELDRLVAGLAGRLEPIRGHGESRLPPHEWAAALAAVRDTFAMSAPLDAALVLSEARLDPGRLEALVRARSGDLRVCDTDVGLPGCSWSRL